MPMKRYLKWPQFTLLINQSFNNHTMYKFKPLAGRLKETIDDDAKNCPTLFSPISQSRYMQRSHPYDFVSKACRTRELRS